MTLPRQSIQRRRLRAPRENRTALVEPALSAAAELLESNARLRAGYDYDFQGRRLSTLVTEARGALLREAGRYTRQYRDVDFDPTAQRIILAGHQPQLFHPGVWFKNFALSATARLGGAVAVNLIIDSDTIKSATLRVPGGSVARPEVTDVAYDRPSAELPYEERTILDPDLIESFTRRVGEKLCPLVCDPLLHSFWPLVEARSRDVRSLGLSLAQGRHQLEGRWGANTLEVPQSKVCQIEAFHWFTAHLLANLPRLWECYNQVLSDYRQINRIRSRSHPVPELLAEGEFLEAPFWIWRQEDPRRRRLFVGTRGDDLLLTDRAGIEIVLPLSPDGDASRAVAVLAELPQRGVRLRSRALMTTLWARLVLGDLFLHGIGGAKYDELTDRLIARFFGLEPPAFMITSATLHLPIDRPGVSVEEARRLEHHLRELTYHPESFLAGDAAARIAPIIKSKRGWIATEPTRENARNRCRAIREANLTMQPSVESQRRAALEQRDQIADRLSAEAILGWREYGFCLYPEQTLRDFLLEFLPATL